MVAECTRAGCGRAVSAHIRAGDCGQRADGCARGAHNEGCHRTSPSPTSQVVTPYSVSNLQVHRARSIGNGDGTSSTSNASSPADCAQARTLRRWPRRDQSSVARGGQSRAHAFGHLPSSRHSARCWHTRNESACSDCTIRSLSCSSGSASGRSRTVQGG